MKLLSTGLRLCSEHNEGQAMQAKRNNFHSIFSQFSLYELKTKLFCDDSGYKLKKNRLCYCRLFEDPYKTLNEKVKYCFLYRLQGFLLYFVLVVCVKCMKKFWLYEQLYSSHI